VSDISRNVLVFQKGSAVMGVVYLVPNIRSPASPSPGTM
jgi:hypothetical protein